jgi:hypothetical protein
LKYHDVSDRVTVSWFPVPWPTEAGAAWVIDSIVADAQRISASRTRSARRSPGAAWSASTGQVGGIVPRRSLIAVAGVLLVVLGVLAVGRSFTPLPRPRARTRLRQGGIFGLVRHPVYGGVILIGLGWSLADAPLGLLPSALLAVLFDLKARREEAWLIERFPE